MNDPFNMGFQAGNAGAGSFGNALNDIAHAFMIGAMIKGISNPTIQGGVGGKNTGMQAQAGINNGEQFPTWSPYNDAGERIYPYSGAMGGGLPMLALMGFGKGR